MSQVFYFGKEQIRPVVYSDFNDVIKQISFLGKDIIKFDKKEQQVAFKDYIEMIKIVEAKDLCFKSVVCSNNSAFLIDAKDELWVFGEGGQGQLGIGMLETVLRQPMNVSRLQNLYFTEVSSASTHVLAISSTFKLYTWGNTDFCSQGTYPAAHKHNLEPEKMKKNKYKEYIPADQISGMKITHIAAGPNYSLVVVNKEHLFSFGKEDNSRLGLGQFNIEYTDKVYEIQIPFSGTVIKGIACGLNHSLFWDTNGSIYSWGDASEGKLGHSSVKGGYSYVVANPQKIKALEDQQIIQASCGYQHSCAINFKGEIYTWGKTVHTKGEDHGTKIDYLRPKKLSCYIKSEQNIQIGTHIVKISSFGCQNAAIDNKGYVYTWGKNTSNCLGHVDPKDYNYPVCIEELVGMRCVDAACGEDFTVIIAQENVNKLAYFKMKEFYTGILDNAKEKINKIKNFYSRKMPATTKHSKEANPLSQDINQLHQLALQKLQRNSTTQFNLPPAEQRKSERPSLNIQRIANEQNAQAKSETFHINRRIRQADRNLKILKGEFKGYAQTSKNERRPLLMSQSQTSYPTTDIAQLTKEIVLDPVTQSIDIDEDEFVLHDETKNVEQRKQIKNDPRVFREVKPKGVLVSSIFKEQIDLIYQEYQHNDKTENLQDKFLKNMRSKEDDFQKSRQKTDTSIRNKFKEARQEMTVTIGNDDFGSDVNSVQNTVSTVYKRPGTAYTTGQGSGGFMGSLLFGSRPSSSLKNLQSSRMTVLSNFPAGDFLKKERHVFSSLYIDQKMDNLKQASQQRKKRTDEAKQRKFQIEEYKQQARDEKRIQIYMNSPEYLKQIEEQRRMQANMDSIRSNWMIYVNAELIALALHRLAELGLETLKRKFEMKDKQQVKYKLRVRDHLNRLRVKKEKSARLILFYCIQERVRQRILFKLDIKRKQFILLQNFMRYSTKCLLLQLKFFLKIWDTHVLNMMRAQLNSKKTEGKIIDDYRNNFHTLLVRHGILGSALTGMTNSAGNSRSSITHLATLQTQASHIMNSQVLQPLNVHEFSSINFPIEDFDTFLQGQKPNRKKMTVRKNIGSLDDKSQVKDAPEDLQVMISRMAQSNSMIGGILAQTKVFAKRNASEKHEGSKGSHHNQGKNQDTSSKFRNVAFNDANQYQTDKKEPTNQKSILKKAGKKTETGSSDESDDDSDQSRSRSNSEDSNQPKDEIVQLKRQSLNDGEKRLSAPYQRSLLPFSKHVTKVLLPSNYVIRIDAMRTDPRLGNEIAEMCEVAVKELIMDLIRENMRNVQRKRLQEFYEERAHFAETNAHLINLQRVEEMLKTPSAVLRDFHQREKVQRKNEKLKLKWDHLPFVELKQIIADRLPNAPQKPQFKVSIEEGFFQKWFHQYVDDMRALIKELDSKGIFKSKKKKEQQGGKQKPSAENEHDQIDSEIFVKAQAIIREFVRYQKQRRLKNYK